VESLFPARDKPRLPKAARDEVAKRTLVHVEHQSSAGHVAVPNPNHQPGTDTPQYADIRLNKAVGEADQALLLEKVAALQAVCPMA
jgi:hypothetical protein